MVSILPIQITDIQGDGYHLMLTIKVKRKEFRLLIDTGASRTVFDETQMKLHFPRTKLLPLDRLSTGLGTSTLQGNFTILSSLTLNKHSIKNYKAVVLDLQHVNESYSQINIPKIDGVLGSDLLKEWNAVIDYGKATLTLTT
jgi:predicted aspartyl protease